MSHDRHKSPVQNHLTEILQNHFPAMKTVALLGGMTYGATSLYYNLINEHVQKTLGGNCSANLLMQSFDHSHTAKLFTTGDWDAVLQKFLTATQNLKAAGADAVMICCNTGHKVAPDLERLSGIPVLHIADYTGRALRKKNLNRTLLLGSKPVLEQDFFVGRLQKYGIDVKIPPEEERNEIHRIIFDELGANIFKPESKEVMLGCIRDAIRDGAQAVIFACTELQFVIKPEEVNVPLFDTLEAHALGAAEFALNNEVSPRI